MHIGQEVAVRFEQHDDVWLPLFEPTGRHRRRSTGSREPQPARAPAAASTDDRFEHRAVLSGVGRSAIGRRLMVDPLSLTVDACLAAVADAGLTLDDIDGLSTYPGAARHGHERGRRHRRRGGAADPPDVDQRRRRPARPGRLGDRRDAGRGRRPVPPRAVLPHGLGVDATPPSRLGAAAGAAAGSSGRAREWRAPFGAMSAANWIGMNANQYLHRYGATREMLGWIALNGRANAARNPAAIYRDPMTMDDYLSARPITTPFGLYDCDVPCDALDRRHRVRRRRSPATCRSRRSGSRRSAPRSSSGSRGTRARSPTSRRCSASPRTSGRGPTCARPTSTSPSSTTASPSTPSRGSRGSGFCGLGEAKDWLDGGRRIALDGELPVNPHGGQLSEGRTHGFGFLYEAVHPAAPRGRRAPGRASARTAVVTSGGGTPSGVLLLRRGDEP